MKLTIEPSDNIAPQLAVLGRNLNRIERATIAIDCSDLTWVSPVSVLPLAAKIYEKGVPISGTNDYLKIIFFPNGVDDPASLPHGKTYLPIIRFPLDAKGLSEKLTTAFIRLVLGHIGFGRFITDAFFYAVDEMVTNVCEHSASKYGWTFAQYDKTKEFLDVVILDQGKGLRCAYETTFKKPYTDEQAIEEALRGISIKSDFERGYGLRTTRKLLTDSELKGKFSIISGTKGYFAEKGREFLFDLESWCWNGTMIIMRLNRVSKPVNYTKYVE